MKYAYNNLLYLRFTLKSNIFTCKNLICRLYCEVWATAAVETIRCVLVHCAFCWNAYELFICLNTYELFYERIIFACGEKRLGAPGSSMDKLGLLTVECRCPFLGV